MKKKAIFLIMKKKAIRKNKFSLNRDLVTILNLKWMICHHFRFLLPESIIVRIIISI